MAKRAVQGLDPRPSDAELLRMAEQRNAAMGKIADHAVRDGLTTLLAESLMAPSLRAFRNAPTRGRMNKTEERYSQQLENLRIAGYLRWWKYGALSLRLAGRTWYRPDFLVEARGGRLEIHEVKGHWEDDARVKFKVAAELYPMFRFLAVRRERSVFVVIETLNPH